MGTSSKLVVSLQHLCSYIIWTVSEKLHFFIHNPLISLSPGRNSNTTKFTKQLQNHWTKIVKYMYSHLTSVPKYAKIERIWRRSDDVEFSFSCLYTVTNYFFFQFGCMNTWCVPKKKQLRASEKLTSPWCRVHNVVLSPQLQINK